MKVSSRDDTLTTGAVSKLVGIGQRTICRLIDEGLLVGWKIPGSQHRRVAFRDLEVFAAKYGIPLSQGQMK